MATGQLLGRGAAAKCDGAALAGSTLYSKGISARIKRLETKADDNSRASGPRARRELRPRSLKRMVAVHRGTETERLASGAAVASLGQWTTKLFHIPGNQKRGPPLKASIATSAKKPTMASLPFARSA